MLSDPLLADLLGPEGRAEVPIAGRVTTSAGDYAVSGQVDRLLRGSGGWHILDFKTNRVVPETSDLADPAYVIQLALYRRLLQEMDPGVSVAATLVWTAGPKIMPIPADLMEKALAGLGIHAATVS